MSSHFNSVVLAPSEARLLRARPYDVPATFCISQIIGGMYDDG